MRRILGVAATIAVILSMILAPDSEADTAAQVGGAICGVLDDAVSVPDAANRLLKMGAVIEGYGYNDEDAAGIIVAAVITYCPYHMSLVKAAANYMQKSGTQVPLGTGMA